MTNRIPFEKRLRQLRNNAGLSLRELAEQLGVHYVYLSQLERGVEKPSENFLHKMAQIFNLNDDEINNLLLMAGKIPSGIKKILVENPHEVTTLLREHIGGTKFLEKRHQEILQMWKRKCANGMEEFTIVEQIKAMRQKGYQVDEAEAMIEQGHELYASGETNKLLKHIAKIKKILYNAPRIDDPAFYSPDSFDKIKECLLIEQRIYESMIDQDYLDKVYGGWLGKCIGGALGMPVEGWDAERIAETYGEIKEYLVKPSTVNDDTSYEIVLLHALDEHGINLASEDIALEWLEHIPIGYTAEAIALENLRHGLMPPLSGSVNNPYSEWVGAQMRGEICGLITPGRPDLAIEYAYKDAIISHEREGVYGEMYNAALVSLAFTEKNIHVLIEQGLHYVPQRSKFAKVIRDVLHWANSAKNWREAWKTVERSYLADYYWVHTFPNIAAVLIGLWFGQGDFEKTICITTMCGKDTDCNAGQAGAIIGTILGAQRIPSKWKEPLGDRLETEVIGFENLSLYEVAKWTARIGKAILSARASQSIVS